MLLKNATFINKNMEVITADIYIKENKIYKIGYELVKGSFSGIMDCSNYLIIPGLVNGHFHNSSTIGNGLFKDMRIENWFDNSIQGKLQSDLFDYIETELREEEIKLLFLKGYIDLIKNGVTFVCESGTIDCSPKILSDTINDLGIRGVVDTYDEIFTYYDKVDGNVKYAGHLLEEEDITEEGLLVCKQLKEKYDNIFMTHCLENEWRKNIVFSKFNKSTIKLFDEYNLLDNNTVLFHAVCMQKEDIDLLAEKGSSIVHCPISNLETGAGIANIKYCLSKGVNVCIGTDWGHTDIWEVMRVAYYLLKLDTEIESFTAEDIFKMATINGAKAFGEEKRIGIIEEGYNADLVFINKNNIKLFPFLNRNGFSTVIHNLIMAGSENLIEHVMVDGDFIMKDRRIVNINEEEINRAYIEILNKIVKGI
ncbi:amidohydrolase family protein [Caloranaerobacter sp. DY30410]|uniref:amidohydrolase family protein n=1 Tax=Caloranaerobacter sp. DY30410 TaxID=3238305 RepID=UPI003D027E32